MALATTQSSVPIFVFLFQEFPLWIALLAQAEQSRKEHFNYVTVQLNAIESCIIMDTFVASHQKFNKINFK